MVTLEEKKDVVSMYEEVEESLVSKVEVEIDKSFLLETLRKVDRSREKKGVSEILQGIYLYFSDDTLVAKGSNASFTTIVEVKNEENFEILEGESGGAVIMDKKFLSIVNSIPRKKLKLSINGDKVEISGGRSKFNLSALDHMEYVQQQSFEGDHHTVQIHPDILSNMYSKTVFACSTSETRPVLQGVNHSLSKDLFKMVSTDAHRLAQTEFSLTEIESDLKDDENFSVTIPSESIKEAQHHLSGDDNISIKFASNAVAYNFGDGTTLISRVYEGSYPDTSKLIPQDFLTEVEFNVEDLKSLLNRADLVAEEPFVEFLLKTEEKQVRVLSNKGKRSSYMEDIVPLSSEGDDIKLAFNLKYLLDALNHQPSDAKITIFFMGAMRPFIIKLSGATDQCLDLILPIRVPGETANPSKVVIENFKEVV